MKKQLAELAKPYYWVNIVLSLSFLIAKKVTPICTRLFTSRGEDMCDLDSREIEILFFLLIVIMIRTRKSGSVTMLNYLSSSFLYTKVANTILWCYSDFRYGLAYILLIVLVGMLLTEPTYKGPENITYFRTAQIFDEELAKDKRINWIICFYTVWNPSCVHFAPVFAELSAEYSLENLKFGKIDIGHFPDVAQKHRISDSSTSRQLPTLILFQNGKEVERRPTVDHKGKLMKFFFSLDNIRAAFDLNNLYKQCVENPLKLPKQLTTKAASGSSKKTQ